MLLSLKNKQKIKIKNKTEKMGNTIEYTTTTIHIKKSQKKQKK